MNTILNFIRFFIAGWWQWLFFMFLAFISSITVVFLPLAASFRQIAKLLLAPFGKEIIKNKDMGTYHKSFGLVFNIIWFPIGLILSIFYFILGIMSCAIIIGIPAGIVMIKLAKIIILPIGIKVVNKKEYIQLLVKEELNNLNKNKEVIKDNLNNSDTDKNKELFIEKKSKENDNVLSEKKYKTDEEKSKENEEIFNNAISPYSKILKKPLFILINILLLLVSFVNIGELSNKISIIGLILSIFYFILGILFISQTYLYITKNKNNIKKYNYEMLFFINTLLLIILLGVCKKVCK